MEENIFEFEFTEDEIGVFNIALVSSPANMTEMIHFSKDEKVQWKMASEEKRILVAPVLIPDQKVYRNNIQGQSGYVFASALTIEKLQQNFSKQQYGNTSNLEHQIPINGVYVSETWLIENPDNDKANALGFKLPKGTWMVAMKVDNQDVWDNYVKTNEVTGFSMEAILSAKKITNKEKEIKMSEEINEIEQVEEVQTVDAIIDNAIEEVTNEIEVVEEAELSVPRLSAVVELAQEMSGTTYETEAEQVETEVVDEEVDTEAAMRRHEQEIEMLRAQVLEYENRIAELEAQNVALEAQIVLVEEDRILLSNQIPSAKPIIDAPSIEEDEVPVKGVLGVLRKFKK